MSSCNLAQTGKHRFKGLETFLRRLAFNLGNTPSQTEVKIISCIPIDVTDLQQKIISLEKQLEAVKCPGVTQGLPKNESSVIRAALYHGYSCHSNVAHVETGSLCHIDHGEGCTLSPCRSAVHSQCQPKQLNCMCWASDTSDLENPDCCHRKYTGKSFFKKYKKKAEKSKKKNKLKTQLVYYAQTTNRPFGDYLADKKIASARGAREAGSMSGGYMSELIRKQYMPVPLVKGYAAGSEFSSPVCRDDEQGCARTALQDSDVCSCCYGPFHNIDHNMPRLIRNEAESVLPTCSFDERTLNPGFYDTSLYDMVPVRDKPKSVAKTYNERSRRKSPSHVLLYPDVHHYPERRRSRGRMQPYVFNHYGRAPAVVNHIRRTPSRVHGRKEKPRRVSPKRDNVVRARKRTDTSDSCCIDCGNVYMKRLLLNKPREPANLTVAVSHRNAECLTNILNDTECQTTTTQSVQIDQGLLEEKKTEETLNQIKTILQSVLTEVKTNTHLKNVPESKPTKDAIVQKGASQGNMPGCSTLLHSYTYSPYNMNPFLASCSRQMSSGPCYSNMPYSSGKYLHNYPVFIQTPPRHMCAGCFRISSHAPKAVPTRKATAAATNTDSKERNKETEKLIKEIYKSITVNMGFSNKDYSATDDVKSTTRSHKSLCKSRLLDEGTRKFVKANASRDAKKSSHLSSLHGKLMSNTMSMRSEIVSSTDTERQLRNRRVETYLKSVDAQKKRQNKIMEEREETPETTASDEEVSSSDTDQRGPYVPPKETPKKSDPIQNKELPKKSIFSKMFKSVRIFGNKAKRKEEQIQVDNEVDEESENSDDYQTVYSQRVDRGPRHVPYPVRAVRSPPRIKAHSKISYCRHMRDRNQERSKRSPYMEQEYRRHWNERLMFHDNQHRHSSDSRHSREGPRRTPTYWQNYEARSAFVGRGPANRYTVPAQTNVQKTIKSSVNLPKDGRANKGLAWLKMHKLGINCGPQWKKLILEG